MIKTIQTLLKNHARLHSEFQIKNFIIGSSGNFWAQYKQCLREIDSRYSQIMDLNDDLKLAQITFKRLKNKSVWFGSHRRSEYSIRLNQAARRAKNKRDEIRELLRELSVLLRIAGELYHERFAGLTEDQRNDLEAQMWLEKARMTAAIEIFATGSPSKATVEFILSMPKSIKRELLLAIHPQNRDKLISWAVGENAANRNIVKQKDRSRLDQR